MDIKAKWVEIFVIERIMEELAEAGITNLFGLEFLTWCYVNDMPACALREDLLAYGKRRFEHFSNKQR